MSTFLLLKSRNFQFGLLYLELFSFQPTTKLAISWHFLQYFTVTHLRLLIQQLLVNNQEME